MHDDDGARAVIRRKVGNQPREFRITGPQHASNPVQSNNIGWPLERAEHQYDSPVLADVCDRLHAASDEIEIRNPLGTQDAKGVQTLWRDIDVTIRCARSRSHKEDVLLLNEFRNVLVDLAVTLTQNSSASLAVLLFASNSCGQSGSRH